MVVAVSRGGRRRLVDDQPGDAWDARRSRPLRSTEIEVAGAIPVIFPSHGLASLAADDLVEAHRWIGERLRPFHGLRAGRDVRPRRADLGPRHVLARSWPSRPASAPSTRRCAATRNGIGCACATPNGPTSTSSPATTWPSTWSCTAATTCSASATFAPDLFAAPRRGLGRRATRRSTSCNDDLQDLGAFAFRAPGAGLQALGARQFLHLRGWIAPTPRHPGGAAPARRRRAVLATLLERLERWL